MLRSSRMRLLLGGSLLSLSTLSVGCPAPTEMPDAASARDAYGDAYRDPTIDAGPDAFAMSDAGPMPTCFEPETGRASSRLTIAEAAAAGGCSTAVVRALSDQLVEEINCLAPGTMARIDGIAGLALGSAALPWIQAPAAGGLRAAIADRGATLSVNSTLRTLPQQLLLYRWYRAGDCGITLAASPGTSPHESGLAIDTSQYSAWRAALERHGFRWHGTGDLPHFDYTAGGVRLTGLSTQAFQRLWNRNHPEDRITEDGDYGPQTEMRLLRSPSEGFPIGAVCGAVDTRAFSVDWEIDAMGYVLSSMPPMTAERVVYTIDGREMGEGTRATGFTLPVGACMDARGHVIDATAYNAMDVEVASRSAYLEARESDAISVRPREGNVFEIALERPSASVAAIEVDADTFALTDSVSGSVRSTRRAVRYAFSTLGTRNLRVRLYDTGGGLVAMRDVSVTFVVTP